MKTQSEYISVSEFAKRKGISRQAVYKKIKNDNQLSTCVKQVDNKIVIDYSLFRMLTDNQADNQTDNQTDVKCQPIKNKVDSNKYRKNTPIDSQEDRNSNQSDSNEYRIIEILKKELEEKNKQIETLQRLLDQEQQLHLIEKNKIDQLDVEQEPQQEKTEKSFFKKIIDVFKEN